MEGPFSVAGSGDEVPVADLTYTQRIGGTSTETQFLADGERAWVVTPERTVEVEGKRLDSLKGGEDVSGLKGLHPTTWFEGEVKEAAGEDVGGTETTSYSGEVDAVAVLNDIVALAGNLGAEAPASLEGENAERVRKAVESSSLEVLAGTDDDILRRVVFEVNLAAGEDLTEVLGDLAGVTLSFDFELTEVNEEVEAPGAPDGAVTTTTRDPAEGPRVTVIEPDEESDTSGSNDRSLLRPQRKPTPARGRRPRPPEARRPQLRQRPDRSRSVHPARGVGRVVEGVGIGRHGQWRERVEHHRVLLGSLLADAGLGYAGGGAVGDPSRVVAQRSGRDALAAEEVAATRNRGSRRSPGWRGCRAR